MGISAHLHIEVRIDGTWHFVGFGFIVRKDYELFERMGMSDEQTAVPGDCSPVTLMIVKDLGYKSASELSLEQLREIALWHRSARPTEFDLRPGFVSEVRGWARVMIEHDEPFSLDQFLDEWPANEFGFGQSCRVICTFS